MIKVSIIVPIYNSEKYLEKCLDSLINQTEKNIEIILVNDGSKDNSEKIIKEYQKNDSRIVYLSQENKGQANARNNGLKIAKGQYISFVDSDDYVDKYLCEKTYSIAKKNDCDIVVFDYTIVDQEKKIYTKIVEDKKTGEINPKQLFFAGACPWNKLFKKSFLEKKDFSFPEGIILEDYAVIPQLSLYNPHTIYLNESFYNYVYSIDSTMRKDNYNPAQENIFEANNILVNKLKNSEFREELEYLVTYHFLYLGSLYFYRYHKYEMIDKISKFMRANFPDFKQNKYVKEKLSKKEKLLIKLFYQKKYSIIKICQKLKGSSNE